MELLNILQSYEIHNDYIKLTNQVKEILGKLYNNVAQKIGDGLI
jgi:hypothetical protein